MLAGKYDENGTMLLLGRALTWYTADVHTPAPFLEGREAGVCNMRLGVLADAGIQGPLLGLQHGRQACVRQALHNHALHQGPPVVVLDVPHPLHTTQPAYSTGFVRALCGDVSCAIPTWPGMVWQGMAWHGIP